MKVRTVFSCCVAATMILSGALAAQSPNYQDDSQWLRGARPVINFSGASYAMSDDEIADSPTAARKSNGSYFTSTQPFGSGSGNVGCDAGCSSGCDAGGCSEGYCGVGTCRPGLGSRLFGGAGVGNWIQRSEAGFDCFISPITNPVYFEDPRLMTEARGIFLQHRAPIAVGGGDVQLYALQLRARLSENVAFIATKDGYIRSTNPVIGNGWADTAAGLKFALYRDVARQRMVSGGFTFELASGEAAALQGNGSGNLNLFLSSGARILNGVNWIGASGIRAPMDRVDESTVFYSSQHLSKNIGARTWLLTEFNLQNWTRAGGGGIPGIEGGDLFNFGSTGVAGNTIVTNAVGVKFKPRQNSELGVAFEYPLTERRDIIDNRINVNWILRY
ncbi:MAG: hypothetical protein KF851_08690 [Pirellulaceae bacterium]|jgi:hypothetical protein|nr:hypothetical protein [Pirellulaceae bacterium]